VVLDITLRDINQMAVVEGVLVLRVVMEMQLVLVLLQLGLVELDLIGSH
jgi:hypothetical protein